MWECCVCFCVDSVSHARELWVSLTPESSAVVLDGPLQLATVFQKVSIVVVNFGIVRQRLNTRPVEGKNSEWVWALDSLYSNLFYFHSPAFSLLTGTAPPLIAKPGSDAPSSRRKTEAAGPQKHWERWCHICPPLCTGDPHQEPPGYSSPYYRTGTREG